MRIIPFGIRYKEKMPTAFEKPEKPYKIDWMDGLIGLTIWTGYTE